MTALSQQHIFRMVAGAVRNAGDGHPEWKFTRVMAESIAKRATGTLTAHLRETLGAKPSESCGWGQIDQRSTHNVLVKEDRAQGAPLSLRRSQLRLLHNRLGALAGAAKYAGRTERAEALIDALRLIAELQERW